MKNNENCQIENWMEEHKLCVEQESKLAADVRLFASEWEIKEFTDAEDKDSYNPIYAGQSERIKALKKKKIWKIINPFYRLYANVKVRFILFLKKDKKRAFVNLLNKISVKFKNRKSVIRKRNKRFIRSITLSKEELQAQRETQFTKDVKFSVLVPLYNTPERFLRDMIESVQAQTYANWELCLADGSDDEHAEVGKICKEYGEKDKRIVYKKLEKNEGISENTNACIEMSTGNYIALFDHDDMLHPAAFFKCMQEIEAHDAEFIFTDEMTFEKDSINNIVTLHFKPDFSPQNLNGVNYICHLSVFKRSLLEQTGLYDNHYDGSQDHDMILKLTTAAKYVAHIPEVLYFWRVHPQSVSMNINAKTYAIDAGRNAVKDNEARLGRKVNVYSSCICATHYRLEYEVKKEPFITVLVAHMSDGKALGRLLSSILKRTDYENYEIQILDFECSDKESKELLLQAEKEAFIHVSEVPKSENRIKALNAAAERAKGEYVVFLESNMEILDPKWLNRLVMYTMQKDIAVTGSRIADQFGMLKEAGYIIGLGEDGVALPIEHKNSFSAPGYIGRMYYTHNVSALGLWGMMVQREQFVSDGGFREELHSFHYAGIDYCLRQRKSGRQVVLEPYVVNCQYKDMTEEHYEMDAKNMKIHWKEVLEAGDPYYNRNFAKDGSFTYEYRR